eukprot:CAMPEP_0197302470 /NCGR_PEP_ID=MMETSP0890-20130614/51071_1 /TAXON_ID=44058 ORGANISM="Aureoumbra lagunensis, Strain CCMP1510" /NCGR_SAMPLE_ID=MMETSP0890 /ASSEMBLY_ACC=CAM_ASM_000533 /LENGTH=79 /DNA_ID=CAMNT_0042782079 /DNA_START=453 /DNA_END=693 /DNA_ORIENTATION=+
MWDVVGKPDAWFWTGDVVYPNSSDVSALEAALQEQRERKEYVKFAKEISILDGTWDDHDLGINDAGKNTQDLNEDYWPM